MGDGAARHRSALRGGTEPCGVLTHHNKRLKIEEFKVGKPRICQFWSFEWNIKLEIDKRGYTGIVTCFTNPVDIAVEFSLQLLLASQLEKGLPILHPFSFFGEFSANKTSSSSRSSSPDAGVTYPLKTPKTRLSIKKEPMTMSGTK